MRRYFSTEGCCRPEKHYMVKLDERLERIKSLYVDRGKYFVINRGRQYGKTTTLKELVSADEKLEGVIDSISVQEKLSMDEMFRCLSRFCKLAEKPVVLMIDEVDSGSNNQVFIDFLSQLRGYYLDRDNSPIFYSVILAGVYDNKNLKLKLRPDEEHQTGMNVEEVAREIEQYTSGHPYLVSSICKYLDEEVLNQKGFENISDVWTKEGIAEAVKMILKENIPLFDSMVKQLDAYKDLRNLIEQILYRGRRISFSPAEKSIILRRRQGTQSVQM